MKNQLNLYFPKNKNNLIFKMLENQLFAVFDNLFICARICLLHDF